MHYSHREHNPECHSSIPSSNACSPISSAAPKKNNAAPFARRPGTNLDDLLLSVGREAGILLYLLATGAQSRRILELGTSYGYSTVWLAAAARATGGKVHVARAARISRSSMRARR